MIYIFLKNIEIKDGHSLHNIKHFESNNLNVANIRLKVISYKLKILINGNNKILRYKVDCLGKQNEGVHI